MGVGKIISLSGIDGVGKTTQLSMLMDKYKQTGCNVVSIFDINKDESYLTPNDFKIYYDYFSNADVIFTRFYLRSAKTLSLLNKVMYSNKGIFNNNELAYRLFKSCRSDACIWFEEVINKLYKNGKTLIFDRYYFDEIAYRALYSLDIEILLKEYYGVFPLPDARFYLKLKPLIAYERAITRNDEDKKSILFNTPQKLEELYLNFEQLNKVIGLNVLNAESDKAVINSKIISFLDLLN